MSGWSGWNKAISVFNEDRFTGAVDLVNARARRREPSNRWPIRIHTPIANTPLWFNLHSLSSIRRTAYAIGNAQRLSVFLFSTERPNVLGSFCIHLDGDNPPNHTPCELSVLNHMTISVAEPQIDLSISSVDLCGASFAALNLKQVSREISRLFSGTSMICA
jgi:hypothetical protein